jgi:acetate---CoA ligase (ADP-forming)
VLSMGIPHKSDVGGVALGLRSDEAVRSACESIAAAVGHRAPDAPFEGFLVAEQLEAGVEMIAGISADPIVGPVVLVGVGGIFAEVVGDVALRLPPFDRAEALLMIGELRGRAILHGSRGRPAGDVDALADALVCLGQLALAEGARLIELDVNPMFVLPFGQGIKAADALVVVAP